MMDLSTSKPTGSATDWGTYESTRNKSAKRTLPTNKKYRPRGIWRYQIAFNYALQSATGKSGNSSRNRYPADALARTGNEQTERVQMEKKIAGLLGAVAALGSLGTAEAASAPTPTEILRANSYADLLEPIPNAAMLLQVVDESAPLPSANENVQLAQFYHHHHHHHHGYRSRIVVVPPHFRRHHHHHHHHHSFYRRDY
jgi:hypothetical protein